MIAVMALASLTAAHILEDAGWARSLGFGHRLRRRRRPMTRDASYPPEAATRFCWRRSIATATIKITPVTTCCQKLDTPEIEIPF